MAYSECAQEVYERYRVQRTGEPLQPEWPTAQKILERHGADGLCVDLGELALGAQVVVVERSNEDNELLRSPRVGTVKKLPSDNEGETNCAHVIMEDGVTTIIPQNVAADCTYEIYALVPKTEPPISQILDNKLITR
jgi:hypothetical protein